MSKPGQNNQKGIVAQNWAALGLFLQFLKDSGFSHIHLEPNNSEDFDLVFKDGKKVICESKFREETFSYSQLKELLAKVSQKHVINEKDKILVVCKNINANMYSESKNIKYFGKLKGKFKKKGFSDQLISMLPQFDYWILSTGYNADANYSLLSELINIWLPSEDIKRFAGSILIEKIYGQSTKGGSYSRIEFESDINALKMEVQQRSDYFSNREVKQKQFEKLEKDINKNKGIQWGTGSLSAFSARWDLMSFAMDRLKAREDINLAKWDDLWKLNKVYYFAFGIFDVFENNLKSKNNRKYIIKYIKNNIVNIRGFYRSDFFDVDVVKIITKIIDEDGGNRYLEDALDIVGKLIALNKNELFYLKDHSNDHKKWELEKICELLHKVYSRSKSKLKKHIFDLIILGFNITEDEDEFDHHAPKEIYEILRDWLGEDFEGRFDKFVRIVSNQYDRFYKQFSKKIEFKGWEHMGGGISFSGQYHVSDRHFINHILAPVIKSFYEKDKEKAWLFIKQRCITKTSEVSKNRPDFLNRSVLNIIVSRYISDDNNISREAFRILKEYILSRKGIPHKSELIYQAIASQNISDDKKWRLVELTINKYGIPVVSFVEQIINDLAIKGHQQAKDEIRRWFKNPKYYSRFEFNMNPATSIQALLNTDINLAIELYNDLLKSDYLKSGKGEQRTAFDIASLLYSIIKKDYQKGLLILRSIEMEKELSKTQQIIYTFSLFNHMGGDDSDDSKLLMNIYREVVDPLLNSLENNVDKIYKRLPCDMCRETFVQFAIRLINKVKIAEALRIIRVFVNDPDPYLPGKNPNDLEDKYNEHKRIENGAEPSSITSVRGWCGWALMKCGTLKGREHIREIIDLSKQLSEDENLYVVHMASFALVQLAKNRLTVLPTDKNSLFLNDDKEIALKMSKEIESISFKLLDRLISWPIPVQKAMNKSVLQVISCIRALNEESSWKLINTLTKLPKEAIKETAPLFIYFAEFRKEAYKDWRFSAPGLYDNLGPDKYDSSKFKKVLIETIQNLQNQDPSSCFRFASYIEYTMRKEAKNSDENEKNTRIALEYLNLLANVYSHNIFNLIYGVIKDKLGKTDVHITDWYNLLAKCFKIEKDYYEQEIKAGNISNVYWFTNIYHSNILELVHDKIDKDSFMGIAKIYFSFPKEVVNVSDKIVSVIKEIAKKDAVAKGFIKILIDKNPSKYWDLRKADKNS